MYHFGCKEEILHELIWIIYHYLHGFSTIPGGCLGFLPSTISPYLPFQPEVRKTWQKFSKIFSEIIWLVSEETQMLDGTGIFTCIYHIFFLRQMNIGRYSIHGAYGKCDRENDVCAEWKKCCSLDILLSDIIVWYIFSMHLCFAETHVETKHRSIAPFDDSWVWSHSSLQVRDWTLQTRVGLFDCFGQGCVCYLQSPSSDLNWNPANS